MAFTADSCSFLPTDMREFQEEWKSSGSIRSITIGSETVTASISTNVELVSSSLDLRPDALSLDYKTSWAFGPIEEQDLTSGSIDKAWRVRTDYTESASSGTVYLARENDAGTAWRQETQSFAFGGNAIDEIDLTFDQAARPVICAQRSGSSTNEVWLYRFVTTQFVFSKIADGITPRVIIDRPSELDQSDVLLMYVSESKQRAAGITASLEYRVQGENYNTAHSIPATQAAFNDTTAFDYDIFLEDAVKLTDSRIAIYVSRRNVESGSAAWGEYSVDKFETILYPFDLDFEDGYSASVDMISGTLTPILTVPAGRHDRDSIGDFSVRLEDTGSMRQVVIPQYHRPIESLGKFGAQLGATGSMRQVVINTEQKPLEHLGKFASTLGATGSMPEIVLTHRVYDRDSLVNVDVTTISGSLT